MTLNSAEGLTTTHGGNFGESTDNETTFGFVLSENSLDYLSVDVSSAGDSSFGFRTKGGETACPYEGKNVTKSFIPGTIIDQTTIRTKAQDIIVDKPMLPDLHSPRNATCTIPLQHPSDTSR